MTFKESKKELKTIIKSARRKINEKYE